MSLRSSLFISMTLWVGLLKVSPWGWAAPSSPYELGTRQELLIFGLGSGAGLAGIAINSGVSPLTQTEVKALNSESVNSFDRSATRKYSPSLSRASDFLLIGTLVSPSLLLLESKTNSDFGTVSVMYLETILLSAALPELFKGTVQRIRPYAYNPNVSFEQKETPDTRRSFYSGHTSLAFSSAVFLSTVYSEYVPGSSWTPWIWTGSLLAASTVGYLRYESGMHFPTDILVGALVGAAFGYLVPLLHRTHSDSSLQGVVPHSNGDLTGLSFRWSF